MPTKIEWCDETWNPVTGCTPISEGCKNCWAGRMSKRLAGRCGYPADDPFRVTFHADQLAQPRRWKKPRRIAVSLMGDLFHEDVPDEWIDKVFGVMAICQQHTFMLLTKRPERMAKYLACDDPHQRIHEEVKWWLGYECPTRRAINRSDLPLSNVWLGTTVENQKAADERIPWLLKCRAAVRFLSCEPLLGPIDLCGDIGFPPDELSWVIAGGESGPGARPMHPDWARSIRDQCQAAGVPFFFKQWGEWEHKWNVVDHAYGYAMIETQKLHAMDEHTLMERVGKRAAGCLLDGHEWNEMPEAAGRSL